LERHRLDAVQLAVLHRERLPRARLVRGHPLGDAAAALRPRVPQQAGADLRPLALQLRHVAEAVDPRSPAVRVVPQLLGLHDPAGHEGGGGYARHVRQTKALRMSAVDLALELIRLDTVNPPGNERLV